MKMAFKKCVFVLGITLASAVAQGQTTFPLYKDSIPNQKNLVAQDKANPDSSVFHRVNHPTLRVYLPNTNQSVSTAVIICAGGGYAELNIKREGYNIAKAFNKQGIAAFVLKYRLPDDKTNTNKSTAPLQDLQQAIKMVRDSAKKWNVDPSSIGVMGFSAGGHLASSAATHFNDVLISNQSKQNLRPDFTILVYPVISFSNAFGHIGSRNNLLGKQPSPGTIQYFSNECHVDKNTPPTFLVHSGDDNIVPVANSIKFYEALNKAGVNADLHIYAKGGHGFGSTPVFEEWFGRCLHWMKSNGFIQ